MGAAVKGAWLYLWGAVLCAAIIYFGAVWLGATPSYPVCDKGYYDGAKHCPSYDVLSALILNIALFFERHSAVVGAAATGVIAWFTIELTRSTRRQGDLTRDAMIAGERAFVFPTALNSFWEPTVLWRNVRKRHVGSGPPMMEAGSE